MSTKTKLINVNNKLNKSNNQLLAIKNAFLNPLPQYPSGIDTSDATATNSDLLSGKTAYAKGIKLVGSHVCSGSVETEEKYVTPTTNTQIITPSTNKYISKVTVYPVYNTNLKPENIKSGVSIFNVTGTYEGASGGTSLDAITQLPTANKYNLGCYCKVSDAIYKCVQASGTNLLGYTDTLIGKTIKLDIEALQTAGKLYEGGEYTASSEVYIDLVNANGSTYDAIRIQIKLKTVNGVNQIEEIYYLYYPGNTGYRYYWYCYGKTSADNTTTYKYFDDNTITFTTDNVQILNDYGYIKESYRTNEWLEYLTIGDVTYNWVSQS